MKPHGPLVYRQTALTRLTHWLWAVAMFFLLLSGLQIFNAHPILYLGEESGFEYQNAILSLGAPAEPPFPGWMTLPSARDLATGRVVHFFFGWVFVFVMLAWIIGALISGHLVRDLLPGAGDLRGIWHDIRAHAQLKFHSTRRYGPLQKLTYAGVLFGLFPLMILSGLAMSPGMNAALPWLTEVFGGRQTARSLHFLGMVLIVLFFVAHMVMILLAGPFNEMRAILTGWYRTDGDKE